MKRIIFSLFTDISVQHQSVTYRKQNAFAKYKDKLIAAQKEYAHLCGAEYIHFEPKMPDYDELQFEKLYRFVELSNNYDEVVYLDLDVIPTTRTNIFDKHADKGIGVHFIETKDNKSYDKMNMYVKACNKNAMLLLHDIVGTNEVANTGVLIGNKNSIQDLDLFNRIKEANDTFDSAIRDNIYPYKIASHFERNNEVYFSYIKELYNVPINPIGLAWNYIVDDTFPFRTAGAHLTHVVNKRFSEYEKYLKIPS